MNFRKEKVAEDPFIEVFLYFFHKHHGICDSIIGILVSYEDIYPMDKSMASDLDKRGVVKGDVVLVLPINSIYFPIVLLGILILGAVVTIINS